MHLNDDLLGKLFVSDFLPHNGMYRKPNVICQCYAKAQFLLQRGVLIDSRDEKGRCCIEAVLSWGGDSSCVESLHSLLIEWGANVFSVNPLHGRSVTEMAFVHGYGGTWLQLLAKSSREYKVPDVLLADHISHHEREGIHARMIYKVKRRSVCSHWIPACDSSECLWLSDFFYTGTEHERRYRDL